MPIHSYRCEDGHTFERLFLTFGAAEAEKKYTPCNVCNVKGFAKRQISVPGLPILYGDGFSKPAPSGKLQTKGRDVTKVVQEENINVTTQDDSKFGVGHMEKAKAISKQIRRSRRT